MVRKIGVSMSFCGLLFAGAGCMSPDQTHYMYPYASSETMTQNGKDHHHEVMQTLRLDELSLADDLDLFFMTERPSRLNRWHSK